MFCFEIFSDSTEGKVAYKYVIDAMPFYDPNENIPPVNPDEPVEPEVPDTPIVNPKERCKMSIGAASSVISGLTLLGALLIVLNKKRNK